MQRTNIYLDERQLEALDRHASEEGTSRADLIRRVLDAWLVGRTRDPAADLAAIDASFGALEGADAPAREPDDRARHLERVWHLVPRS